MKKIVLLRHGQSQWNLENRFTGWADIDLTEKGIKEARRAGELLKAENLNITYAFTSYLKRANKTLNIVLDMMDLDWIPVEKAWELNGRHYGDLEGKNKIEVADKYGEKEVHKWRRGFNTSPPLLEQNDSRSPLLNLKYQDIPKSKIPLGESLEQASARILPYWNKCIITSLKNNDCILVAAHGNTLRAIVKHVKRISDEEIKNLNIPTAAPYIFEFDDSITFVKDYFLGDSDEINRRIEDVASQSTK